MKRMTKYSFPKLSLRKSHLFIVWAAVFVFALAANAAAQTLQDFDLTGAGTRFMDGINFGSSPPAVIGPGPTGDFLRLKDTTLNINNTVSFDRTDIGPHGRIVADFDFRITCRGGRAGFGCADGFSFVLLNTDTGLSDTSGPVLRLEEFGRSVLEIPPSFVGQEQFGVGFITFGGSLFNNLARNNTIVLTFNNGFIAIEEIPLATFDLATGTRGSTGAFHHAHIDLVQGGGHPQRDGDPNRR